MSKVWLSKTETIEADGTNIILSEQTKIPAGIIFSTADVFIDDDGDDLRIGVKTNADILFMNGSTDVAKINETGVTDLIP